MNIQHQRLFFLLLAASLVTGVVHSIPDSAGTSAKSSTFSKVNTHLKKNRHGYAAGLGLVGALNLADLFAKGKLKKAYFKKMFDRENRGTTIRLLLASLLPLLAAGAVEVNGHGYQEDQEPSDGLIPEEPSLVSGSESVVDESEEVVNSSEAPSPVSASSSFASPPVELRKPERPVTPPVVATVSNLETQGVLLRTAPVPQVNISGALKPSNNSEVSSERPPVASSRSIVPVTVPEKNVVSNPSAMADSASAVSTIKDERRTSGSRFSWATPAPSGDESIKDRMLIGAGGPSRPASPKLPILSPEGEPAAGAGGSTLQKGDEDPRKAALASMIDAADEDPDIVFHDSNTIHFVIGNIGKQFKYYQDVCALWNDLYGGNYGMLPRELEAEQSTALHEALRGMVRRTEGNDAEAHEMAQKLSRQFSDSDLIFFILSPALKEVRAIKELETKHFESAQEKRDAVMEKRCELQRNFFAYELGYSIIDFDPLLNFFLQQLDAILASVPSTAPAAKSAAERAASVVPVEELSAPPLKTSRDESVLPQAVASLPVGLPQMALGSSGDDLLKSPVRATSPAPLATGKKLPDLESASVLNGGGSVTVTFGDEHAVNRVVNTQKAALESIKNSSVTEIPKESAKSILSEMLCNPEKDYNILQSARQKLLVQGALKPLMIVFSMDINPPQDVQFSVKPYSAIVVGLRDASNGWYFLRTDTSSNMIDNFRDTSKVVITGYRWLDDIGLEKILKQGA